MRLEDPLRLFAVLVGDRNTDLPEPVDREGIDVVGHVRADRHRNPVGLEERADEVRLAVVVEAGDDAVADHERIQLLTKGRSPSWEAPRSRRARAVRGRTP